MFTSPAICKGFTDLIIAAVKQLRIHVLIAVLMLSVAVPLVAQWENGFESYTTGPFPSIVKSTSQPTAYYPFNGNANDESGNGNHGTLLGGASVNNNFLLIGNNGQNAVSIPNSVLDGANDFTVSATLRIDVLHTSGGFPFNSLLNSHSSGDVFDILYRASNDGWAINTMSDTYLFGNTTIEDNFWHHVVFRRENSSVTLFIDGVEVGTGTVNSNPLDIVAGTLIVGQDRDSQGGPFAANQSWAGGIDNLRIYRSALDNNKIQEVYQTDRIVSPSGLVAFYPFNGNANDESGTGNDGLVHGATLTADRFGNENSAYQFDGQTTYIEVPDSPSLDITGPISLAAWLKADLSQYFRVGLIDKRPPTEPSGGYDLIIGDAGSGAFAEFDLVVTNTPLPSIHGAVISNSYVNDNTWHHLAATYDGQTMKVYVDGQLENQNQHTKGYVENDVPMLLGKFDYGYNDGHGNKPNILNGAMDEIRVYNCALSAEEVEALYRNDAVDGNSPHNFLFLATKALKRGRNVTEGDIHSSGALEFNKGNVGETDHTGNVTAVGKIKIRSHNKIEGDVLSATDIRLGSNIDITGTTDEDAAVVPVPLTLASFTANNDNRKVNKNKTLFLPPGTYGAIKLSNGATLELAHTGATGEYFFERIEFNKNCTLKIDARTGPVTMNVVKLFKMRNNGKMELLPDGAASSDQVTLNYLSTSKMQFGSKVQFFATIVAPNAQVSFSKGIRFKGSVCARQIRTRSGSVFFSHSSSTPLPPAPAGGLEDLEALTLSTGPDGALPTEFALEGNYPNPFNPSTTINFALPQTSEVKLMIYNIRGQLVRTLVSGFREAGHHKVVWNGRDKSGVPVASGLYIYRLRAGEFTAVRKMMFAK